MSFRFSPSRPLIGFWKSLYYSTAKLIFDNVIFLRQKNEKTCPGKRVGFLVKIQSTVVPFFHSNRLSSQKLLSTISFFSFLLWERTTRYVWRRCAFLEQKSNKQTHSCNLSASFHSSIFFPSLKIKLLSQTARNPSMFSLKKKTNTVSGVQTLELYAKNYTFSQ